MEPVVLEAGAAGIPRALQQSWCLGTAWQEGMLLGRGRRRVVPALPSQMEQAAEDRGLVAEGWQGDPASTALSLTHLCSVRVLSSLLKLRVLHICLQIKKKIHGGWLPPVCLKISLRKSTR